MSGQENKPESGLERRLLVTAEFVAELLSEMPLIRPANTYVFPTAVPGEEDALARGSVWLNVRPRDSAAFLAQLAVGFRSGGVAQGLIAGPAAAELVVFAGGYGYRMPVAAPAETRLLELRPVVSVWPAQQRLVLAGFHHLLVLEREGEWASPRLTWEGLRLTHQAGSQLHGFGWHMRTDRELPFVVDLEIRTVEGGAFLP